MNNMKLYQFIKNAKSNESVYIYIKNYLIGFGTLDNLAYKLKPYEYKDIKKITYKKEYTVIDL